MYIILYMRFSFSFQIPGILQVVYEQDARNNQLTFLYYYTVINVAKYDILSITTVIPSVYCYT
jgi:hypothetical protein